MNDALIHIKPIPVKDLPTFAAANIASPGPGGYIAITEHRAAALAANPLAEPDDVGLLVAYDGEQVAGYFGIMTVQLQYEGKLHKVYWFTTWSAAPNMRGRGVGSALMQAALDLEHDYMIVGSAPARHVCAKFGFDELPPLHIAVLDFGLTGRYNPVALGARALRKVVNILGGKLDISAVEKASARWFERWLGYPLRAWARHRAMRQAGGWPDGLRLDAVEQVREASDTSLDPAETRLYRDARVVNWMLKQPWVRLPGESSSEHLDYYFTDTRPGFGYDAYEVYRDAEYLGYLVVQRSILGGRRVLRVLDVALADETLALPSVLRLAVQDDIEKVEMNAAYAQALQGMRIYQRHRRIYQVHPRSADSPLARAWRDLQLDFADGDMAFT